MSVNTPPNPNVSTFNNLYWIDADNALTYAEASKKFLKFPTAQGTENLKTTNVSGLLTASGGLTNGNGINLSNTNGTITLNNSGTSGSNALTFTSPSSSFSLQLNDTVSPNFLRFITSGTSALSVSTAANIGIRTTTPSYPLDVVGYTRITGTLEVASGTTSTGILNSSGLITANSGLTVASGTTSTGILNSSGLITANSGLTITSGGLAVDGGLNVSSGTVSLPSSIFFQSNNTNGVLTGNSGFISSEAISVSAKTYIFTYFIDINVNATHTAIVPSFLQIGLSSVVATFTALPGGHSRAWNNPPIPASYAPGTVSFTQSYSLQVRFSSANTIYMVKQMIFTGDTGGTGNSFWKSYYTYVVL